MLHCFSFAAVFAAVSGSAICFLAAAPPRFASIFGDHMVLQRDAAAPVWGTADPGKSVTVSFAGQSLTATADPAGKWLVRLRPFACPPENSAQILTATASGETVAITDILIGDVWICAGQSNMAFKLSRDEDATTAAASATDSFIRICDPSGRRTRLGEATPADLDQADWKIASPATVPDFSAVAYYFARELRKSVPVPIGLVDTSVGGTPMRCWMSRATLKADPVLRPQVAQYDDSIKKHPKLMASYQRQFAAYEKRGKTGRRPYQPKPLDSSYRLAYFHDSVIRPIQPLSIRGVIWYQGEADAGRYATFEHQFATLVSEWRREWGQGNFPWLYVQLAPYSDPNGRLFPRVWEAQQNAMKTIPNSAMVVSLDHGEAKNIHPPHKQPIAARLALAARALTDGETTNWRSPEYQLLEKHGDKLICHFDNVQGGFVPADGNLKYFTIAGPDRKFVPAQANISGNTVIASSPQVPNPVAVRYGWYELRAPVGASLYRSDKMPAAPFRTDNWPDQK